MKSAAGRVLGLTLVMMSVMSVVGLAASQTFINKTGKAVTGIKIEFSRSVTVTRHDSVFPDQSTSGRSDEFTFDGGKLRNLGRFAVSWMPSSGKVTDYEWIEKAQPSEEQQSSTQQNEGSSLPDPNTSAILYGNNYPGPDEPQYQPAPDEQLWLTDLDGHGDIYDNDSIRINHAPGFDMSQITKIDVYRNGIKLRFVPEKFDVLTNAQMKTFDGNPAEHSPASNHTDHAIMGYEYEFKISTADHLWILKKTVKSGFKWRPKEVWAYLQANWVDAMGDSSYSEKVAYFTTLKNDGFTGVSIDMDYYMDSLYDNEVKILPSFDLSIIVAGIYTASDSDLETMLKAIAEAGLDAHVRGQIFVSLEYQKEHGFTWSGDIDPNNPNRFFENYTQLWLDIIPILNQHNVKLITPFTEMDGIEKYPSEIKEMYDRLSNVFCGELGLEQETNMMMAGYSQASNYDPIHTPSEFRRFAKNLTFWGWANPKGDSMRIEYSAWVTTPKETQRDQRSCMIAKKYIQTWSLPISYYSSTYPLNLQMWGEIGAKDFDGYVLGPEYFERAHPETTKIPDEQERSDVIYAILEASRELTIESINLWSFITCDMYRNWEGGNGMNIGYARPPSPEYRVIKAIIAPEEE